MKRLLTHQMTVAAIFFVVALVAVWAPNMKWD